MRNETPEEFDGYDMRQKNEMSEVELRKANIEAQKARTWIEKNMGIKFPSPEEAIKTGSFEGKRVRKAEMA